MNQKILDKKGKNERERKNPRCGVDRKREK